MRREGGGGMGVAWGGAGWVTCVGWVDGGMKWEAGKKGKGGVWVCVWWMDGLVSGGGGGEFYFKVWECQRNEVMKIQKT